MNSQDELVLQLYTEAQTQVALVLLTAFHSMKSQNNEQPFYFRLTKLQEKLRLFFFFSIHL